MSRSTVSRLCESLDEQVKIFRERRLEGRYPYLWLDAKIERVREPGGVRQKALVIAYAVHETGRREVIGIDLGEAETEAFWRDFLRSLRARGLGGVKLCASGMPTRASKTRSAKCWACHRRAAPCTSSATCSATSRNPNNRCRCRHPPSLRCQQP